MEANDFIARLKAEGTEKDLYDLSKVTDDYKVILQNLGVKDRGAFSLNVLCILCRNLDKVPSWRDKVDGRILVTLSIDCVSQTHSLPRMDQVKVLACIYHIHKHVIRLVSSIQPELILKLSFQPFECEAKSLLQEYCKTYWNILVDRMAYVEKLKSKTSISKLLPKITEDALKVIYIYDSVQFCTNVLVFLVKNLHLLFNDTDSKELHQSFGDIFKRLSSKTDLASFKKLSEKDLIDIYMKLNSCFYVIAENSSKTKFESYNLNIIVRTAITMLGHNKEIMRCLETFFLNGFCSIFENLMNATNIENVLNNMFTSLSMDNVGYEIAMNATYPFLNQCLRLLIEFTVSKNKLDWSLYFNEKIQIGCLNLILFLSSKKSEQFAKCENCKVKSGLHDSLRLLFLIKHFPISSISQNLDITNTLPVYYKLVTVQHTILLELKRLGCPNHDKYFRKLQTDIHNTAIALNKANYYDYSIKLFNLYIEFEMRYFKDGNDLKNISRALYNKSICELDNKIYVEALQDACLSLIFSLPDGLGSEKYMSLVMDIKARALKGYEGNQDEFQATSILDVCKKCVEEKSYGNLKPFLVNLNFIEVLKHEFELYAKFWPSIVPIGGVWKSLYSMFTEKPKWLLTENDNVLLVLFEVILKTCTVVRTVHNEQYSDTVKKLLDTVESDIDSTCYYEFMYAALLFLQCEYDLAEASKKYGWKTAEPSMDPDQTQVLRTIPQEHEASKRAIEAVHVLSLAVKNIEAVGKPTWLYTALQVYQVFVMQLLHLCRDVPALELTNTCCIIAEYVGDSDSYVRNASLIIALASSSSPEVTELITKCCKLSMEVSLQTRLSFMCDAAIYYSKIGSMGVAAKLVNMAQAKILQNPDVNLELAIGRLLEAQARLCRGQNALSVASGIQRHYLAISNTETKWSSRRHLALTLKYYISGTSVYHTRVCRSLLLWRRARCACAACVPAAAAVGLGRLFEGITNVHKMDDAQTKIDNRLKNILGLQPSNESQTHVTEPSKPQFFTPRHENLETMLEDHVFKKTQLSPSLTCISVFGYKTPDFFKHDSCGCGLCDNPYSFIIACTTSGLESSMYYRAKEMDIARNYFDGTIKSYALAESKIRDYFKRCRDLYSSYIIDIVEKIVYDEFKRVQVETLIEAAFFELSNKAFEKADDFIVRIHDILQDMTTVNPYVRNEVMNLMIASSKVRKSVIKPDETGLEIEMESLKLSPYKEPPKTPVNKYNAPPKLTKNIVANEELPIVKRKVIKLNLDETQEEKETKRPTRKRAEFKIPVPVTSKPVLEMITPRTRSKPDIVVTKPTEDVKMTPKCEESDFFTPKSTPAEQFFTPMTSLKTYSKKSLRSNIVKNLEAEFSTPKGDKENSTLNTADSSVDVPKSSARAVRAKVDKKSLKRATSPGKLTKEVKPARASRLKAPINFKVHEDEKK